MELKTELLSKGYNIDYIPEQSYEYLSLKKFKNNLITDEKI